MWIHTHTLHVLITLWPCINLCVFPTITADDGCIDSSVTRKHCAVHTSTVREWVLISRCPWNNSVDLWVRQNYNNFQRKISDKRAMQRGNFPYHDPEMQGKKCVAITRWWNGSSISKAISFIKKKIRVIRTNKKQNKFNLIRLFFAVVNYNQINMIIYEQNSIKKCGHCVFLSMSIYFPKHAFVYPFIAKREMCAHALASTSRMKANSTVHTIVTMKTLAEKINKPTK